MQIYTQEKDPVNQVRRSTLSNWLTFLTDPLHHFGAFLLIESPYTHLACSLGIFWGSTTLESKMSKKDSKPTECHDYGKQYYCWR